MTRITTKRSTGSGHLERLKRRAEALAARLETTQLRNSEDIASELRALEWAIRMLGRTQPA